MSKPKPQIYLAYPADCETTIAAGAEDFNDHTPSLAFGLEPNQAAEYIVEILVSVRAISVKAQLDILSDLIEVAIEEAKLHSHG